MACATFGCPFCIDLNRFIRKIAYRMVARATFSPPFVLSFFVHVSSSSAVCLYVCVCVANAP